MLWQVTMKWLNFRCNVLIPIYDLCFVCPRMELAMVGKTRNLRNQMSRYRSEVKTQSHPIQRLFTSSKIQCAGQSLKAYCCQRSAFHVLVISQVRIEQPFCVRIFHQITGFHVFVISRVRIEQPICAYIQSVREVGSML